MINDLTSDFRTFQTPKSLERIPEDKLLDALEEFWEAEAPRIGEPGAQGWAAWFSSGRPDHNAPTPAEPVTASSGSTLTDPYVRWWHDETTADRLMQLPTRSTDDDSDPYATILFSDNRPLLVHLRSAHAKNAFRLVWLSLLGLHVPGLSSLLSVEPKENWDDRWSLTHLTSPACLTSIFPTGSQTHISTDSQAGVIIGREKEYSSGFGPVKNWSLGILGPLENSTGRDKYGLWTKEEVQGVDEAFVKRVFEQLRLGPDDVEWNCYSLAFEAALSIKR